jgi:hypothetical protein
MKRTEFFRTRGDATIILEQPPLGFYQATLKVNGIAVETARFSVLGTGAE